MNSPPIVILGAGLAGLCCARQLLQRGVDFLLLDAADEVGGRVRTDERAGFRLDRGFQVLQTAYPEARAVLDYKALHLSEFEPGAWVQSGTRRVLMSDPWRRPRQLLTTLTNGIGTLTDRWRLARLRRQVTRPSLEDLWQAPDGATAEFLRREMRLSIDLYEKFLRPWFAGVFLESDLATSSRFFRFVFRMFADGAAALPEQGMGAIPRQLAAGLHSGILRLKARVESLDGRHVRLATGESLAARAVVLAVEGPEAARLSGGLVASPASRSTSCLYYAADKPPFVERLLFLNGDRQGPVNHLAVPSNVAASYAPTGRALISASVVGETAQSPGELELAVRSQLRKWFGGQVDRWSLLKTYQIRHALPGRPVGEVGGTMRSPRLADGLYTSGDHCTSASIQGAMLSGRLAAESLLSDLDRGRV